MDLKKLLRPHIAGVKAYSSARDEYSGQALVYLDANENAYGSAAGNDHHRYPDPYQSRLKDKVSELKNMPVHNIFLGHGSDEPIDLLIRAFCQPGMDRIITLPPTYGMYGVSADINHVENLKIPLLGGFQPDVDQILEHSDKASKILFLCTPNNPTGNSFERSHVLEILDGFRGIVVIDEAYIDFAPHAGYADLLEKHDNLVILQTFSKAWGMASLRLGMAFADRFIVGILNKLKPPYNISGATQEIALEALSNARHVKESVARILEQKKVLTRQLNQCQHVVRTYPSDANFVLAKMDHADRIYSELIRRRVIVRDRSRVALCEGCLRITVGTEKENKLLIETLNHI
jgi:histidinol-phosphate aminotransferase